MADKKSKLSLFSEIVLLLLVAALFTYDAFSALYDSRPIVSVVFKFGIGFLCLLRIAISIIEYRKGKEQKSRYILNMIAALYIIIFLFIGIGLGIARADEATTKTVIICAIFGIVLCAFMISWALKSWRAYKKITSDAGKTTD